VYHSPRAGSLPVLLDALGKVRCPLQVMVGTADVIQQPSVQWRMARVREAAPHAEIALLPGVGHWAQYEDPETYNRLLLAFMTQPGNTGA
jgi:pimeloyl-ACP methyl ester carboxylesterase